MTDVLPAEGLTENALLGIAACLEAPEHDDINAQAPEGRNSILAGGLRRICHGNNPQQGLAPCKVKGRFALVAKRLPWQAMASTMHPPWHGRT